MISFKSMRTIIRTLCPWQSEWFPRTFPLVHRNHNHYCNAHMRWAHKQGKDAHMLIVLIAATGTAFEAKCHTHRTHDSFELCIRCASSSSSTRSGCRASSHCLQRYDTSSLCQPCQRTQWCQHLFVVVVIVGSYIYIYACAQSGASPGLQICVSILRCQRR